MKKYIRLFVMLMLCGGFFLLGEAKQAKAVTISDQTEFVWEELSDGTVKITGMSFYHESVSRLIIPESIYGKTVSSIGGWSLCSGMNKVEEIVLPDTVAILEEEAFAGLMGMSRIVVSEDNPCFVMSDNALYSKDKKRLYWVSPKEKEFQIPNGVEWIGYYTFLKDSQVESIYISDEVNLASDGVSAYSLTSNIFCECANLKRFVVSSTHLYYKTSEGVLYSKDGKKLHLVPRNYGKDIFIVPEGVTEIGSEAFCYCTDFKEIVFSDSVESLGAYSFKGCTGLQREVIPDKITLIPYYAFLGCSSLQEIVLPETLRFIGGQAFDSCVNLSSVVYAGDEVDEIRLAIESGVKWEKSSSEATEVTTDEAMFLWKTNNKGNVVITGTKIKKSAVKIVIPSRIDGKTVEEIANRAFSGHERLRSVTIPETVRTIGEEAFWETPALEEIVVDKDNPNYRSADGNLYNKEITYLYWVTADQTGAFIIPETVRGMDRKAFDSCKKVTSIHIQTNGKNPQESFNIGTLFNDNFSQCTNLSAIWVDGDHPYYSSTDGVLFSRDGKRLLAVPPAFNVKNYKVPYNVQEIGGFSFSGCYKIETVTIPDGIATIELFAFMNCPSIKEISVGHGLTEIGEKAFYYCDALEKVTLPDTLVYMDEWAMEGCYNLTELVLPVEDEELRKAFFYGEEWFRKPIEDENPSEEQGDNDLTDEPAQSVEPIEEPQAVLLVKPRTRKGTTILFSYQVTTDDEVIITGLTQTAEKDKSNRRLVIPDKINGMQVAGIDGGAFANIPLSSVTLPEGLLEIGMGAFYGCNLTDISIPASVCYIGQRAFGANYGMKEINVSEENASYTSRAGVLYNKDLTMICQMPANYPYVRYTLPGSVQVIGEYAFGNCRNVEIVYIPAIPYGEVEVREKAFWNTDVKREFKKMIIGEDQHYSFDRMDFVDSNGVVHDVTEDGYLQLSYEEPQGELRFSLHSVLDLIFCAEVSISLKNEVGEIAVILYDKELREVSRTYIDKCDGDRVIPLNIERTGRVEYVGIRATDAVVEDDSCFTSVIYEITARMK